MSTVYKVHQIWLQGESGLPDKYKEYVAFNKASNPDYKLWDEKMIRELIQTHYEDLLATYDSYPYWVMRVDLAKYVILYHEGGLYSDMDLKPLQSFVPLMELADGCPTFYLKKAPHMVYKVSGMTFVNNNWFYVPTAKHTLFKMLMDYAKVSSKRMCYDLKMYYILNSTGPQFMMDVITRYEKNGGKVTILDEDLTVDVFYDEEAKSWFSSNVFDTCDKWMIGAVVIFALLSVLVVKHQLKRVTT